MHRIISAIQAVYDIGTGVWRIADMDSFLAATGPKTDLWLVEMVGLLASAIGAGTAYAVITKKFDRPLLALLILAAGAFIYVDMYYSLKKVISFMYLPDAVCQLVFIVNHAVRLRKA